MRGSERIAKRVRQLHSLQTRLLAVQPLNKEIRSLLLLRGRCDRQDKSDTELGPAERIDRIPDLAGDLRLRYPLHRLFIGAVTRCPAAVRRPGNRHRGGALKEVRQVVDEVPLLHPGWHPLVFGHHLLQHPNSDIAVDSRLHRARIEELSAFHAEPFLVHVLWIGSRSEEARAVRFGRHLLGDELADLGELLPVLGRREFIAHLGLELRLHLRILEDVFAVVQEHHVAVVGKPVDLVVDLHLVVTIRRRNVLQLLAISELVHERIQRFECAGFHEIGHPRRNHIQRVVCTGLGAIVLHDLGEHLVGRHLDHLDLDAGELFPLWSGVLQRIK